MIYNFKIIISLSSYLNSVDTIDLDGGITKLLHNGYLIRAFANSSEAFIECFTEITTSIEQENNL